MLPHSRESSPQSAHFLTAQKRVHWRLPQSWGQRSPPGAGLPTAEGRGVLLASSQLREGPGSAGFLTMRGDPWSSRLPYNVGRVPWVQTSMHTCGEVMLMTRHVLELHLTVFHARTKQVQLSEGESPMWGTRVWSHRYGHSNSWVKRNDPGKHPKKGTVLSIHKF